jgi:DNA (cytosine-5)-methyltransferase 1
MVGFRMDSKNLPGFNFPEKDPLKTTMSDIWGAECEKEIGYTLRVGGRRSGLHDRRNWDTYKVGGEVKVISPKEGLRMMGFPHWFNFKVSDTQAMKQLGNSVAVNAVKATGSRIIEYLQENEHLFEEKNLQVA